VPVGVASRPVRAAIRMILVLVLALAIIAGSVYGLHSLRDERTAIAALKNAPKINGRIPLFHGPADQFVDFIRANVPSDARVRIVQPARTSGSSGPGATGECGQNVASANYWLLAYEILPRVSVCADPQAWIIYYGVAAPPGDRVRRFSDTLAVQSP